MSPDLPTAAILSQGNELVTGEVVDTNAAWLAERLTSLGFRVLRHVAVADRLAAIEAELAALAERVDLVVGTGGLGPTTDDLTTQAVSRAFGCPLRLDRPTLERLEAHCAQVGRPLTDAARKQAWLPEGSIRLDNDRGTAPGFALAHGRAWFVFLPGVPYEMEAIFVDRVEPDLRSRFVVVPSRLVTLRATGTGESVLQVLLHGLELPRGVELAFRAFMAETHVKLRFAPSCSEEQIRDVVEEVGERIADRLFAIEGVEGLQSLSLQRLGVDLRGGDLAACVGRALVARGETLAVAESCTGGQLGAACTQHPGSSRWFLEGAITYSNAAKIRQLGVEAAVLERHGAVSEPVARQMAEGIRSAAGSTYGLATTGIAGPGGGSEAKPVGTVYVACSGPSHTVVRCLHFKHGRRAIQAQAVAGALELLRRRFILSENHHRRSHGQEQAG